MKVGKIKELGRKIEQGAWIKRVPGMEDLQLKVRAKHNSDYQARERELFEAEPKENKPVNPLTGVSELTDEARRRHDATLLLDTVLIDWKNLEADDSTPENRRFVPYSREAAESLLLDPKEPAFGNAVSWASMVVAERGELDAEADAKN